MRKKLLCTVAAVAMLSGLFVAAATPASAAPPFGTQNFLPDDTTTFGVTFNVLSDRFDGTDSLAHLTNVSTADTTRVKWFACPAGTAAGPGDSFGGTAGDQAALANCTVVIGEDTTPTTPAGGGPGAPVDEAYDIPWDIPGTLDGANRDILGLSCIGPGDDVEGPDQNCAGDIEDNTFLEDAQTGAIADQTTSGEMISICTDDNTADGPGVGPASTRICEQVSVPGTQTQAQLDARFQPFPHGSNVPNNGFVLRATSSDDVTSLEVIGGEGDAETDPHQDSDYENTCTLLQTATNFKRFECFANAAQVVDGQESYVEIDDETGGSGACAGDAATRCGLDSHYVVAVERAPTTAEKSFDPEQDVTAGTLGGNEPDPPDISSSAGCEDGENRDDEHSTTDLAASVSEEGCLLDQFGVEFDGQYTVEFTGVGGLACEGTSHDHNDDGVVDHCHGTTGTDGVTNWALFNPNADVGDQNVTFCFDAENGGTDEAPPANHGCADETVQDTNVMHWQTAANQVFLAYAGTGTDPNDPCRTGETFKNNQVGDFEDLIACTFDSEGNPVSTQPNGASGGRLTWEIETTVGGELTGVRFTNTPPSETQDPTGQTTTRIEAFRESSNFVIVNLHDEDTGDIIDSFQIEKRIEGGRSASRVTIRHRGRPHRFTGRVTSQDSGCESGRLVRVRRRDAGPDTLIGSDTTNANGNYRVNHNRTRRRFRYYARIGGNANCGGDTSGNTPRVR